MATIQANDPNYCMCPKCEGTGADRLSMLSLQRGSLSARRTAKRCTRCGGIGKVLKERAPIDFTGLDAALDELRKPVDEVRE